MPATLKGAQPGLSEYRGVPPGMSMSGFVAVMFGGPGGTGPDPESLAADDGGV
jgi:hypothetical protein